MCFSSLDAKAFSVLSGWLLHVGRRACAAGNVFCCCKKRRMAWYLCAILLFFCILFSLSSVCSLYIIFVYVITGSPILYEKEKIFTIY